MHKHAVYVKPLYKYVCLCRPIKPTNQSPTSVVLSHLLVIAPILPALGAARVQGFLPPGPCWIGSATYEAFRTLQHTKPAVGHGVGSVFYMRTFSHLVLKTYCKVCIPVMSIEDPKACPTSVMIEVTNWLDNTALSQESRGQPLESIVMVQPLMQQEH